MTKRNNDGAETLNIVLNKNGYTVWENADSSFSKRTDHYVVNSKKQLYELLDRILADKEE
jgi:hypothetical protein